MELVASITAWETVVPVKLMGRGVLVTQDTEQSVRGCQISPAGFGAAENVLCDSNWPPVWANTG